MTEASTPEFSMLKRANVVRSLTNPRKHFDAAYITELAQSAKQHGIIQPLLVRPLPGHRVADTPRNVTHEIVCGECRDRASEEAGLDSYPVMIKDLSNDQVLEIQIIENLKRRDLSELEEAEGYGQLMQHLKITADQVGEKIGMSRSYVYGRLKLLDLCPEAKASLREGKVDASRALLVARIPDSKLQIKALEEAQRKDFRGDVSSVRSFQAWLKANVMLYLEHAVFKITDARLLTSAGSCKECPKRTGANPDLFTDVDSADMCTDPVCYHAKEEAHRAQLRARAEKKGMRIIEGTEAKELVPNQWTSAIRGYSKLDAVREDGKGEHKGKTLRAILGDKPEGAVLIEHPYTKELIEAVPTEATEAALIAKGMLRSEDDDEEDGDGEGQSEVDIGSLKARIDILTRQFERQKKQAQEDALMEATIQAVRATSDMDAKALIGPSFLRSYLLSNLDEVPEQYMARALGYTFSDGEDEQEALAQHIKACSHAELHRATVLVGMHTESYYCNGDTPPIMTALSQAVGVDAKAVQGAAVKALKAKYTAEVNATQARIDAANAPKVAPKAAPKTAKTPPSTPAPAAQAREGAGGKKPKAVAKLTAKEATQGIAAAMQGLGAETSPAKAEEGAASAPVGAVALPAEPALFVQGQRVRVTTADERLSTVARKWAGKEGTITKTNAEHDPDLYDVTFKGRSGGVAMFRTDQLEGVAA